MQFKTFLITLSVATLTACAVDSTEQQTAETESETHKNDILVEERVRELAGRTVNDQSAIITMPAPMEDKAQSGVRKSEPPAPVDNVADHVIAVHEHDAVLAAKHRSADSFTVMQTPQSQPGLATTGMVQNNIRHASEPLYRENYQHFESQQVIRVSDNPVSTFSIDVDTGAYANMRRWLNQGQLPPEDAVRVEEFINYFDYDYPIPKNTQTPFQVNTEIAPTPWNMNTRLLRIGIQGYRVPKSQLPASNLVFLIDVSGSMNSANKLPLLQQALTMLTNQLDARDSISMVVYAGASGVVLPPTRGDRKADILVALQQLRAGGSTNGAAGIRLAYQMAEQHFIPNGVNRVILATDGDFNVGLASTEELIDMIQRKRKAGIALTTLGFGSGNYNDHLLEQLADEGNGNYAYIDRLSEARKVLSEELSSTLLTIAKDVKIQIEFNPAQVSEYRLIGYENRLLNEEDFANDKVDAGEIGAGHRVTALYEVSLVGSESLRLPPRRYQSNRSQSKNHNSTLNQELAHLRIRYKLPGESTSSLIESPVMDSGINARGSDSFNFAASVAAFGQKLRGGKYLEAFSYTDIAQLASQSRGSDPHGYRSEFMQLVNLAGTLDKANNVAQQKR
jgi:Ca-activated chloride channel family protein